MKSQSLFPLDNDIIYINHAAISPWPLAAQEAVNQFAQENVRYGSRYYPKWLEKEQFVKQQLARLINAPSADDIALLKNTSEALSIVAYGLDWKSGDNIVSSKEEFPSNRIVWESLASRGVNLRLADFSDTETSPEDQLISLCDHNTRLLTISAVQFASGLRHDLKKLGQFCKQNNILFCIDAIQVLGALEFDAQAIHADFVMADAHKWMTGPEGIALFYAAPQIRDRLKLTQYGWHMVRNPHNFDNPAWQIAETAQRFECGSPNMLGIHALAASLSILESVGMPEISKQVLRRSHFLLEYFDGNPDFELLTPIEAERHAGIVTFRHREYESERLYQQLSQQNVMCAHRGGGVRFSPHFYTPLEKLEQAIEIVNKQVKKEVRGERN